MKKTFTTSPGICGVVSVYKKLFLTKSLLTGAFLFLMVGNTFAQSVNTFWKDADKDNISVIGKKELITAKKFRTVTFDIVQFQQALVGVKHRDDKNEGQRVFVSLPLPNGEEQRFEVFENNTMSPGLKDKFPDIRSYDAVAKNGDFVKFDITPQGFHAMILSGYHSTVFIDPYVQGDLSYYKVYYKGDFTTNKEVVCAMTGNTLNKIPNSNPEPMAQFGTCQLRTYRLAVSATGEYTAFQGGTKALAQAAQVTTMNRVNGMYERDIAITMSIVPNNDLIVYTNSGTDPFTNGNTGAMITENQTVCDNNIGSANYDIGHVFGTNSGGLAGLGVVCSNGSKARGVTGSAAPTGDPFDIDYVAHEMGHQFGANHTQNNNCNRNNATAMEPGSASTIMGYAGICAPDVQSNSDDHFHAISLEEIHNEITSGAHSCPVITALANNAPTITGTNANVTVPANTPFALTAFATDADGDVLTYQWDQMDNQVSTQPPSATSTSGPNFRSNSPTTSPTRYMPNLADLAAGISPTWEVIPSVSRTMNFRVIVRDQSLGTPGCNDHDDVTVTFDAGSGPFLVTYPSATGISWTGLTTQTVTWSVANTNNAPVSCSTVDLYLSTDGGATYPTLLANDVINDGSQVITVPNTPTTTARIMVMCSNGTFFDISDNNFEITMATNDFTFAVSNPAISVCPPTDAVYTINTGSVGGYSDAVTLSVTGLPAGASGSFGASPITPGNSTTYTVTNTGSVAPGTYTITLSGTSTTGTKSVDVTLSVSGAIPSAITLSAPSDGASAINIPVSFSWSAAGAGDVYQIQISTDSLFSTITDSVSGLITNNYTSNGLSNGTVYYWRVRAYNGCGSASFSQVFTFETVNAVSLPPTGTLPTQTACSGVLYDNGGSTGQYTNNEDAQVTIAPTGANSVDLNFLSFDVEPGSNNNCDYDYLLIYDGPTTGSTLIGTYCNDNVPSTISSTGSSLTLVFHSDGGVTHNGFEMTWQCQLSNVPPVAAFTASDDTTCTGEITFTDASSNGPTSWLWNFGDGNTSTDQNPTHIYAASGSYTVTLTASNAFGSDPEVKTNLIVVTLPTAPATTGDSICGSGSLNLLASGTGSLVWYDSISGGTQIATGTSYTTPVLSSTTTYYVESQIASASLYGAKPDFTGNGGNFKNSQHLIFDAYTDFEIVSVEVTATGAGNRTVEFRNNAGTILDSRVVNVPDGVSRINLNFNVTAGTGYQLGIDGAGTVDLFRNNGGVTYPYDLAGLGSVTGSSAGTNFYYFYYNWELKTGECVSARTPVTATVLSAPVVFAGNDTSLCAGESLTLTGSGASSYTWNNSVSDGVPFTLSGSGTTAYVVSGSNGACSALDTVNVTVNSLPALDSVNSTNASCGSTDGTITIYASGGTGTFTYSIDGGSTFVANGGMFTGLDSGSYNISVLDGNCTINGSTITLSTITAAPAPGTSADTSYCSGEPMSNLVATGTTGTLNWYSDSTLISNIGTGSSLTPSGTVGSNTYYVAETVSGCEGPYSAITITVNALPTVSAGSDLLVCEGSSATLNGSGASAYSWNNGVSDGVAFTVTGSGTTLYVVTGTDGNGCVGLDSMNVTAQSAPVAAILSISDSICGFSGLPLIATSSTGNGIWNANGIGGNTAFSSTTLDTTWFTPNLLDGVVEITWTSDSNGACPAFKDTIVLTFFANPTVFAGNDTSVCTGAGITLSGSGASSYVWDNGVTNGVGFTTSGSGNTTYTVLGTDGNGCQNSDQIVVTVNALPTVSAGTDQSVCVGSSVTLSGSGATSYTWNNGVTDGLTFTASGSGTTTYIVTGTAANSCQNTDTVNVTVNALPVIDSATSSPVSCGFNDGTITIWASGGTGSYSYSIDSGATFLGNGGTFTGLGTGNYYPAISDGNCVVAGGLITLSTAGLPPAPVTSANTSYCDGAPLSNMTATGTTGTLNWYSDSLLSTYLGTGSTLTPSNTLGTTTYYVAETVAGCEGNASTVQVTINALPMVSAGPDQSVCAGSLVTLSGSGATSYTWNNGITDGLAFTASGSGTTTYIVTGTAANSCQNTDTVNVTVSALPTVSAGPDQTVCAGSLVTLSGSGATSYTWNNGVTDGLAFTASGSGTTAYIVTGTAANSCQNTDTVNVTVSALPTVSAGPNQTVCAGSSVTLSGSGATSYTWNNGITDGLAFTASGSGTIAYIVTGTAANSCQNTDTVNVTVSALPTVSAGPDQSVCAGSLVTLSGSGATSYTWNNGVTDGLAFTASGSGTTTYIVTGTAASSCQNTDTVNVTVTAMPTVSAGPDQSVCAGSLVTLSGSGATSYTWNNGVTDGLAFTASGSGTTAYMVTGTDLSGCQNTDVVNITVVIPPTVSAGANKSVCAGSMVTLSATGAISYTWNNGVSNNVPFMASGSGITTYIVTGTDIYGCQNTDSLTINVNALPNVDAGMDQTVCAGSSVTMYGSGASAYSWDNGILNGVPFTATGTGTTTYVLTGITAALCQNTDTVNITVLPTPIISNVQTTSSSCGLSDGAISIIVADTTGILFSIDGGFTYYSNGGIFPSLSSGSYAIMIQDGSCSTDGGTVNVGSASAPLAPQTSSDTSYCQFDSVSTISAAGAGGTISWYSDSALVNLVSTSASINPSTGIGSHTYYATEQSGGCESNSASVTITIHPLPNVSGGADQEICNNDSITLSGSGADTYAWNNGVTDGLAFAPFNLGTTSYIVTGTDTNGCQAMDTTNVTVYESPDTSVRDMSGTLTAQAGYTYQWLDCDNNMAPLDGQTNQELSTKLVGHFAVEVSNGICTDTSSCHSLGQSGIEGFKGLEYTLWPNPSEGVFQLQLTNPNLVHEVKVFDATGRLVRFAGNILKEITVFDIREEPAGMYLIVLVGEQGTETTRIVKE